MCAPSMEQRNIDITCDAITDILSKEREKWINGEEAECSHPLIIENGNMQIPQVVNLQNNNSILNNHSMLSNINQSLLSQSNNQSNLSSSFNNVSILSSTNNGSIISSTNNNHANVASNNNHSIQLHSHQNIINDTDDVIAEKSQDLIKIQMEHHKKQLDMIDVSISHEVKEHEIKMEILKLKRDKLLLENQALRNKLDEGKTAETVDKLLAEIQNLIR